MTTPRRPRRWFRVLLVLVGLLLVAVVIAVLLLPTMLESGPGRRLIARVVNDSIRGTVSIGQLDLSWTGSQSVSDLVVKDPDGNTVADLDIEVDTSLLGLARGHWRTAHVVIGGLVETSLREDGSTTIGEAVASRDSAGGQPPSSPPSPSPSPSSPPSPPRKDPATLPAGMDASVDLKGLAIRVHEVTSDRTLEINGLNGSLVISGVRPVSLQLRGGTTVAGRSGTFGVDASAANLVQPDGTLTWSGASAKADVSAQSVVLPVPGMTIDISNMSASLDAPDLTGEATLSITSTALLNGDMPSELNASLVTAGLFTPTGDLGLALDGVRGSLEAKNVPTALAQPFLTDTGIVVARDIGPTIDAVADFGSGTERQVRLNAKSERLALEARAAVDPSTGAIVSDRVKASAQVMPALAEALAGLRVDRDLDITVDLSSVRLPGAAGGGARNLADAAIVGAVAIPSGLTLLQENGEPLASAESLALTVNAPRIGDGADFEANGAIEGGQLRAQGRVENLVDANGVNRVDAMRGDVTASITDLRTERLVNLVDESQRALAAEALRGPIDLHITKSGTLTGGDATATVKSPVLDARLLAAITAEALTLTLPSATVTVTPELVAAAQSGGESPIALVSAQPVTIAAAPVTIPRDRLSPLNLDGVTVKADVTAPALELDGVPGTSARLALTTLDLDATATIGGRTAAKGNVVAATGGAPIATITFDGALGEGESAPLEATVVASSLRVAGLETLLGREAGSLTDLVGEGGDLRLEASRSAEGTMIVHATPALDRLKGRIDATVTDALYTLDTTDLRTTIRPALIERWLNEPAATPPAGAPAAGAAPAGQPGGTEPATGTSGVRVTDPIELAIDIKRLTLDPALLGDEPVDSAKVAGEVRIVATPVRLSVPSGEKLSLSSVTTVATIRSLAQPVTLSMQGASESAGGALQVTAALSNLLDASSRLAPADATVDLDATASNIPTAVLDRMQNFGGKLVAALGDLVTVNAKAVAFSRQGGTLSGSMVSPNGRLDIPEVRAQHNTLVIDPSKPVTGQLQVTPALREQLLHSINPILADIRTVEQPLQLHVPTATIPLDGNLSGFNASAQLTVGRVEFDPGSSTLRFLELFNQRKETVPGLISPLNLEIAQGQLTYKDFSVKVGPDGDDYKQQLVFAGDVNLAADPPFANAITARYPADGLSRSIKEIPPVVGFLYVEITFYGPLYNAAGESIPLKYKINVGAELPKKPEDILKEPAIKDLLDQGIKGLLDRGKKDDRPR